MVPQGMFPFLADFDRLCQGKVGKNNRQLWVDSPKHQDGFIKWMLPKQTQTNSLCSRKGTLKD